ncbi:MAG TPA: cytochrome ubiquinol oxidase subunit I [Steroidobacter sp.]|nr:cytochrome ubiquinol oxidase subunit I [Steroidobacter sp.]
MIDFDAVNLSRLQFALTAMYHFLFVPLTLGLSLLLAIMESVYVMTGRRIWRDMTMFWGILFGINFAMGVATGITMEFQFGTNWAYYSHYVGDVFGAPLALEGLTAFFLEATFIGLFFFAWDKLSRVGHLAVTWCVAIGANLSALWILIANAWMQNPVGSEFNFETMRMEVTDFFAVLLSPIAQSKFVHTVSAGYVTGSIFVLAISAWYLLRGRHVEIAKRSMTVAASFGLASALSVVVLGDESGYVTTEHQKMKLAAIEGAWQTHPAPAPFTVFGLPSMENHETRRTVNIPWVLGLVATRSISEVIPGIYELVAKGEERIRMGLRAYDALQRLREDRNDADARAVFWQTRRDLGYALLLRRFVEDPRQATPEQIRRAAWSLVPDVPTLFWSFRLMVAIGFFQIILFAVAFWFASRRQLEQRRWFLHLALWSLPLPWIASQLGWIVAEYGRQPWIIEGVMPTFLGVSVVPAADIWMSIAGFVMFYTGLLIVDLALLTKYIRIGPAEYWRVPDIGAGHPIDGGMYYQTSPLAGQPKGDQ